MRQWVLSLWGFIAAAKVGSLFAVTFSMALSLFIYAAAFGLAFAAGLMVLLFLHEAGHLTASAFLGLKARGPYFVPFLGAMIELRKLPTSIKTEAHIALAGPALGTLSALGCLTLWHWLDSALFLGLSYAACLLNLFNLIPCAPLDGDRIAMALSSRLWWLGSACLACLYLGTFNIFVLIILLFSLFHTSQREKPKQNDAYYALSPYERIRIACWYFGLIVVLSLLTLYLLDHLH